MRAGVTLLGFTFSIDLSIKPGKAEDGGGMYMSFTFVWKAGRVQPHTRVY